MRTVVPHFQEELQQLKTRLLEMGGLAEERVRSVVQALVDGTAPSWIACSAATVQSTSCTSRSTRRCFKLLALHQPMAVDLRAIVSAVKINTDLERVGDLAINIAEAVKRYMRHSPVKELIDIPRMADIAQRMLRDALDAYVRRDVALAQAVLDEDDALDALKTQVFRELLTYMLQDPEHHRAGARSDPDLPPPRADRRPRHQRRRGRHLHGVGARRPPPRPRDVISAPRRTPRAFRTALARSASVPAVARSA